MTIDTEWHRKQVSAYIGELDHYRVYADVLDKILSRACELYAPPAMVKTRTKSVSSFSEKVVRRQSQAEKKKETPLTDPVSQFTDLCGARVITQSLDEANELCRFIEANFTIDEQNSEDTRSRLEETEFGYLGVHYVVQMKDECILGVHIGEDQMEAIGKRKAEIQVLTLLQHTWAEITHDRFYKVPFKPPPSLTREAANLAAELESADKGFNQLIEDIDSYREDYAAYMNREEMESEIETLELILANEKRLENRPGIALRIAMMARAAGYYEKVVATLGEFEKANIRERNHILIELGHALCELNKQKTESEMHKNGQNLLSQVLNIGEVPVDNLGQGKKKFDRTRAMASSLLASSYRDTPGKETEARNLYRRAVSLDPSNPYYLASLLEYELYCSRNWDFLGAVRPALFQSIRTCRLHADVKMALHRAFFTMGKLYLLAEQPYESLANYAKAVQLCLFENLCFPEDVFDCESEFLRHINVAREFPPEHEWVRRVLLLAKSQRVQRKRRLDEIKHLAKRSEFRPPVLIIAGGSDFNIETQMPTYRDCLFAALKDFKGTVVSGGTKVGISGLVGAIASELVQKERKEFQLLGYLPKNIPHDAPRDDMYTIVATEGNGFGPGDPLQMWIDLVAADVKPADVRVLGIGGGRIAEFEYKLALALGATVGLIHFSGGVVSDILSDSDWCGSKNLIELPLDMSTVSIFINPVRAGFSRKTLDRLARAVHNKYLEDNRHQKIDSAMVSWKNLSEDFKESNRGQVIYAELILGRMGFGIHEVKGQINPPEFTEIEIDEMAKMEHGRWVVERLAKGWRWGPIRDPEKHRSPYLVPWEQLPLDARKWDVDFVRNWPDLFKKANLEIYRQRASKKLSR